MNGSVRRSPLALARRLADLLNTAAAVVGGLALASGLLVIFYDVVARAFGHPLRGSPDIIQMSFVLIVFGSIPMCERVGGNVKMDLFEPFFSKRLNRIFDFIGTAIGATVFGLLAWRMWASAQLSILLDLATNILRIPKMPFQIAVVAFCLIVAFSMVIHLAEMILGKDAKDPSELSST